MRVAGRHSCCGARHGAARRTGRRPRGVVGRGTSREEDAAVREIIAAFEQKAGKQVELVLRPQEELAADLVAAVEAGRRSPDFVFSVVDTQHYEQWAYEGRLVDLSDAVGHFSRPVRSGRARARHPARRDDGPAWPLPAADGVLRPTMSTPGRACSSAPASPSRTSPRSGRRSGPSGATRSSRRCARRSAATTSGASASPCRSTRSTRRTGSEQFIDAYEADYVTRDGRLVIDDPEIRRRLIKAIDGYTADLPQGLHAARFSRRGTPTAITSSSWRRPS